MLVNKTLLSNFLFFKAKIYPPHPAFTLGLDLEPSSPSPNHCIFTVMKFYFVKFKCHEMISWRAGEGQTGESLSRTAAAESPSLRSARIDLALELFDNLRPDASRNKVWWR